MKKKQKHIKFTTKLRALTLLLCASMVVLGVLGIILTNSSAQKAGSFEILLNEAQGVRQMVNDHKHDGEPAQPVDYFNSFFRLVHITSKILLSCPAVKRPCYATSFGQFRVSSRNSLTTLHNTAFFLVLCGSYYFQV